MRKSDDNKDWRDYYEAPFKYNSEALLTFDEHIAAYINDASLRAAICLALNGDNVTWIVEAHGAKYYAAEQEVRDDNGDTLCDIRGYSWLRLLYGLSSAEADAIVDSFGEEVAKIINKLGKQ